MKSSGKNHPNSNLTLERVKIVKQRIAENYYERDDVLLEVAKKILDSHDLDDFVSNYRTLN